MSAAQPLNTRNPISNEDGTPTDYFIKWAQQFSGNALPTDGILAGTGIAVGGGPTVSLDAILDDLNDVDTTTVAPTNGQVLNYDSGSGLWVPGSVSGSSNPWWWSPPAAADFPTAFTGAGSAAVITDDTDYGLIVRANNTGTGTFTTRGYGKTVPAAGSWTVETHTRIDGLGANYVGGGLYIFETGTNKCAQSGIVYDSNFFHDSISGTLTSFGGRGSRYLRNTQESFSRIRYVSASNTYFLDYSMDGKVWFNIRSFVATAVFTTKATHVGIGIVIQNAYTDGAGQQVVCDRWVQSW